MPKSLLFLVHLAFVWGAVTFDISPVPSLLELEREATIWDMEEKNLYERHQLLKQQLKDQYFLQRHQLLKKHEKVNHCVAFCLYPLLNLATTCVKTQVPGQEWTEAYFARTICHCRSRSRCSATISGWLRFWKVASSRRGTGCRRSSAARPRPAWPCSRRACASTRRAAPPRTGRRSNR